MWESGRMRDDSVLHMWFKFQRNAKQTYDCWFFWPLHCLSFDVRVLITPVVSSNCRAILNNIQIDIHEITDSDIFISLFKRYFTDREQLKSKNLPSGVTTCLPDLASDTLRYEVHSPPVLIVYSIILFKYIITYWLIHIHNYALLAYQ